MICGPQCPLRNREIDEINEINIFLKHKRLYVFQRLNTINNEYNSDYNIYIRKYMSNIY